MSHQIRLYGGLVLFLFVAAHLANHSLGVVSIAAMERVRPFTVEIWRTLPGTVLLACALAAHVALSLRTLYVRRTLRLSGWETAQLVLGLLIPPLLVGHVLGTRGMHEVFDVQGSYALELYVLWVFYPALGIEQTALLLVTWLHGCIGLHTWLRLKPWYVRHQPVALALAALWPALALAGFVSSGMEVKALAADPAWVEALAATSGATPAMIDWVFAWSGIGIAGFALLLGAVFAARKLREALRARSGRPRLRYPGHPPVEIPPGASALEAIRVARIPHASICGGRGRCSTCRVRVGAGGALLPPPAPEEQRVLQRISAPPAVRLACQIRPVADLEVTPLLPSTASAEDGFARPGYLQGQEQPVTVLFADMRDFTRLADRKLPFDVVFVLNRYFDAIGKAVEDAGGRLDTFIGDGVMALFGVTGDSRAGCRQALAAARQMAINIDVLNETLSSDLEAPLRIAIGIHVGPAIIGEIGYNRVKHLTAIGDAVNIASRLESLAKQFGAQLVASEPVAEMGGYDMSAFEAREVTVRGSSGPLRVRVVPSALALQARPAGTAGATTAAPAPA